MSLLFEKFILFNFYIFLFLGIGFYLKLFYFLELDILLYIIVIINNSLKKAFFLFFLLLTFIFHLTLTTIYFTETASLKKFFNLRNFNILFKVNYSIHNNNNYYLNKRLSSTTQYLVFKRFKSKSKVNISIRDCNCNRKVFRKGLWVVGLIIKCCIILQLYSSYLFKSFLYVLLLHLENEC